MLLIEDDATDESDNRLTLTGTIFSPVEGTTFSFNSGTFAFAPNAGDVATKELPILPQFDPGGGSSRGDSIAAVAALRSMRISDPASVGRLCSLFGARDGSWVSIFSAICGVSPKSLWILRVCLTRADRSTGLSLFIVNRRRSASVCLSWCEDGT